MRANDPTIQITSRTVKNQMENVSLFIGTNKKLICLLLTAKWYLVGYKVQSLDVRLASVTCGM